MQNTPFQNIEGVHMTKGVFTYFRKAPFPLFPSDHHWPIHHMEKVQFSLFSPKRAIHSGSESFARTER